jgi:hypothetical protein
VSSPSAEAAKYPAGRGPLMSQIGNFLGSSQITPSNALPIDNVDYQSNNKQK